MNNFFKTPLTAAKNKDHDSSKPTKPVFLTVTQFCDRISISRSTFYRRLKSMGEKAPGGLLSPKDQEYFCEKLGIPYFLGQ